MKVELLYNTPNYDSIMYFTFRIEGISRVTLAQLTRHNDDVAYSVESQRYVDVRNDDFVKPPSFKEKIPHEKLMDVYSKMLDMYYLYDELIDKYNVPKEDARFLLPQASKTNLIMTIELRPLLNFFNLRLSKKAQWEIRELAQKMLKLCKDILPDFFEEY